MSTARHTTDSTDQPESKKKTVSFAAENQISFFDPDPELIRGTIKRYCNELKIPDVECQILTGSASKNFPTLMFIGNENSQLSMNIIKTIAQQLEIELETIPFPSQNILMKQERIYIKRKNYFQDISSLSKALHNHFKNYIPNEPKDELQVKKDEFADTLVTLSHSCRIL